MVQTDAKTLYPKKILLALFIFGLVILAGKIIYTQFDSISFSFLQAGTDAELASAVSPNSSTSRQCGHPREPNRARALPGRRVARGRTLVL